MRLADLLKMLMFLIDKNIIVGRLKLIGISLQTLENIIGCPNGSYWYRYCPPKQKILKANSVTSKDNVDNKSYLLLQTD